MGASSSRNCAPSRGSPQGSTPLAGELLLKALENLPKLDFKKFRDALAHGDLQGRSCIPRGRLEKADWMDTKNLMLDFYGAEAALDVAVAVLERIQLRNAAAQLQENRKKGGNAERLPSVLWGPGHPVLGVAPARASAGGQGDATGRAVGWGSPGWGAGGLLQGGGDGRGFEGAGGSATLPPNTPFSPSPGVRSSAGFITVR